MKKKKNHIITNNTFNEFLLYTTPNGRVKVEIYLHDENIWLTQEKISRLFGVQRPAITKHLKNIFESGELDEKVVCSLLEHTTQHGAIEGKTQTNAVKFYNLDAIISIGYRVNSAQATHFRIWATERLKEYIIKGFTMDDERLKNPDNIFGKDYFDEQLERIRDIRSSERRFYQKITDIYSQCSADYNKNSEETKSFFATVQNKLHWAISKQTASEIIASRADSNKDNMGLTSWKNAPDGKIRKTDVSVAKNYLNEQELDNLNRIVSLYLDFAELQAKNKRLMTMVDWIDKLDAFLQFNEQDLLTNAGKVTAEIAKTFAEKEYEQYRMIQDRQIHSDFDKHVKSLTGGMVSPSMQTPDFRLGRDAQPGRLKKTDPATCRSIAADIPPVETAGSDVSTKNNIPPVETPGSDVSTKNNIPPVETPGSGVSTKNNIPPVETPGSGVSTKTKNKRGDDL